MIWSVDADDYESGITIYDGLSGVVYSQAEAENASAEIKGRLLVKTNKRGCYVMTDAEAEECLKKRGQLW